MTPGPALTPETLASEFADKWHFGSAQMRDLVSLLTAFEAQIRADERGKVAAMFDRDSEKVGDTGKAIFKAIAHDIRALASPPQHGENK